MNLSCTLPRSFRLSWWIDRWRACSPVQDSSATPDCCEFPFFIYKTFYQLPTHGKHIENGAKGNKSLVIITFATDIPAWFCPPSIQAVVDEVNGLIMEVAPAARPTGKVCLWPGEWAWCRPTESEALNLVVFPLSRVRLDNERRTWLLIHKFQQGVAVQYAASMGEEWKVSYNKQFFIQG